MKAPLSKVTDSLFVLLVGAAFLLAGGFKTPAMADPAVAGPEAVSSATPKPAPARWMGWLSVEERRALANSVPPKPAPASDIDKADLQKELDVQRLRAPSDVAEATKYQNYRIDFFTGLIGPGFTKQSCPVSFQMLQGVSSVTGSITNEAKNHNMRSRPFQEHTEVKNLFPAAGYSYPSGHSSCSRSVAVILGQLFPAKAPALLACADAVARSRVTAGVHYTSDIEAGKILGQTVADALLKSAAFQSDFNAAKAEIAEDAALSDTR